MKLKQTLLYQEVICISYMFKGFGFFSPILYCFLFLFRWKVCYLFSPQVSSTFSFYFNTDDFIKSWNLLWRHTNSSKRPWVEFQLEFKSCRKDTWEPSEGHRGLIHCHCHLSWLCISFNSGSSLWEENSIYAICDTKNWS